MNRPTLPEISRLAEIADEQGLESLRRTLDGDDRKGVASILAKAERRLELGRLERERIQAMYDFECTLAGVEDAALCVGLDEVGRGPVAGPLAIGAVVLPNTPQILGLNDSKQLKSERREELAREIEDVAVASTVCFVSPFDIDEKGISACLKAAFQQAIVEIDAKVPGIVSVLLDGNPLHIDARETNVVKGDSKCASIAAASIIAKVARDNIMIELDDEFPGYGFASNKGYGTEAHMDAIQKLGLSDVHRRSFCSGFFQETLF